MTGTPRFILVPLIVVIYRPKLKHLFIIDFALVPFWKS